MGEHMPPGYQDLKGAISEAQRTGAPLECSLTGIVVDFLPAIPSKGTDFQITFTIRDPSLAEDDGSLKIKCFRRSVDDLPRVRNLGDVVLLRNVRISLFQSSYSALLGAKSSFIVFPKDKMVTSAFREQYGTTGGALLLHHKSLTARNPSVHEQQWAINLAEALPHFILQYSSTAKTSVAVRPPPPPSNTSSGAPLNVPRGPRATFTTQDARKGKFSLIKDVKDQCFYDLCVEVLKMRDEPDYLSMWVTDYTEHPALLERDDDWPGPQGRMTLKLELRPPHNSRALQNFKVGDFVDLQNVRIKVNRKGSELEGNIWHDRYYPEKILVRNTIRNDDVLSSLKTRRASCKTHTQRALLDGTTKDRGETTQGKKKKGKNAAKKNKAALAAQNEPPAKKRRMDSELRPGGCKPDVNPNSTSPTSPPRTNIKH